MPIVVTSKKSPGCLTRFTTSQRAIAATKSRPRVETKLGRRKRAASVGAEASAATDPATLLRSGEKSYEVGRATIPELAGVAKLVIRAGFKIRCPLGRVGSSPTSGISNHVL